MFLLDNYTDFSSNSQLNSLTTKSRQQNFCMQILKKVKSKLYHIENSRTRGANSADLDEVAHYEPPHQDLR